MAISERVLLVLFATILSLGPAELVRREILLHRRARTQWTRLDAGAIGAFLTVLGAVGASALVATDRAPAGGLAALTATLLALAFLLLMDDRVR